MATERRTHELDVSEPLFRLATECVHLVSNDTRTLATLETVVAGRTARAAEGFPGHALDTLRGHLDTLKTAGAVRITIELDAETDERFAAARESLAANLERPISLADLVSVLLFDLATEATAASMLDRLLGETGPDQHHSEEQSPGDPDGNVVPIR